MLQIIAGWLRLGSLMRFVGRAVIIGFVNALAILIFLAKLPELTNVTWVVYAMVAGGLAIIYLFPYLTKAVPSPPPSHGLLCACDALPTTRIVWSGLAT